LYQYKLIIYILIHKMHDLNKKLCSAIISKCIWDINAFYKSLHNKT